MFKNRMTALIIGLMIALAFTLGFTACDDGGGGGGGWVAEYSIGDTGPGGGIIFYVDSDGFTVEGYGSEGEEGYFKSYTAHYLEAAPEDFDSVQWGGSGTLIGNGLTTFSTPSSPLLEARGNGRKDTQIIAAHLRDNTTETGRAAQLAAAATFGDLDDWFLPSTGELRLMSIAKNNNVAGLPTSGDFLSSSQGNASIVWGLRFLGYGGGWVYPGKNEPNDVRAVRAF